MLFRSVPDEPASDRRWSTCALENGARRRPRKQRARDGADGKGESCGGGGRPPRGLSWVSEIRAGRVAVKPACNSPSVGIKTRDYEFQRTFVGVRTRWLRQRLPHCHHCLRRLAPNPQPAGTRGLSYTQWKRSLALLNKLSGPLKPSDDGAFLDSGWARYTARVRPRRTGAMS